MVTTPLLEDALGTSDLAITPASKPAADKTTKGSVVSCLGRAAGFSFVAGALSIGQCGEHQGHRPAMYLSEVAC